MANNPYFTSFNVSSFQGINQAGDGYNMDMRYAREMENVNITGGSFTPMRAGVKLDQGLDHPIGTLAYLARRYGDDPTTIMMAVSDRKIYTKHLDSDDDWVMQYPINISGNLWYGIFPTQNDFDWVTYEVNTYPEYSSTSTYYLGDRCIHEDTPYRCISRNLYNPEEWNAEHWEEITSTDPVDVLLFTNAADGMYCLYGDTLEVVPVTITPDPTNAPDENIKFGVIARYNERIWGSGIAGDPDKLMYSTPYDPFNWEQNSTIPEDGAGDILQPTWDGDSFVALKQFGSDLLALKRNSVWRISGTDPGTFAMQMMYGSGTVVENTLAIYNNYAYMLGDYGLMRYDGSGAYPFNQDAVKDIMRNRMKHSVDTSTYPTFSDQKLYVLGDKVMYNGNPYRCIRTINTAGAWAAGKWQAIESDPTVLSCAGMWNGVYCLAIPLDGSDQCNAILQYNIAERTFSLRTGVSVDSFLQINERLFYTSAQYPGEVFELDDTKGRILPVKWISGYQDLGVKSSIKSAFVLYMMVETETEFEMWLGLRTEKKLKKKLVKIKPGKLRRVNLNTSGREFRLEIQSYSAANFRIAGGLKMDLELDPD